MKISGAILIVAGLLIADKPAAKPASLIDEIKAHGGSVWYIDDLSPPLPAGAADAVVRARRVERVNFNGYREISREDLGNGVTETTMTKAEVPGSLLRRLSAFPDLTSLQFAYATLPEGALSELASVRSLKKLHLVDCDITDERLAELKRIKSLTSLWLAGQGITESGLAHLRGIDSLQSLRIERAHEITGVGVGKLRALQRLQRLELVGDEINDAGLREVAGLRTLTELTVWSTRISDNGVAAIKELKALRSLSLSGGDLTTDESINHIASLPNLSSLFLASPKITNRGL